MEKVLKKSISSRINKSTYDKMVAASKKVGHRFYDRKVAYMVNKVLDDWADKEK
jgi:thermostable 8-oxoguanine DNA glycosylase